MQGVQKTCPQAVELMFLSGSKQIGQSGIFKASESLAVEVEAERVRFLETVFRNLKGIY